MRTDFKIFELKFGEIIFKKKDSRKFTTFVLLTEMHTLGENEYFSVR